MTETSRYCDYCRRYTLARKEGVNHVLHLLISLFLCGLWLPFWLLIAFCKQFEGYHCTRCGGAV